MFFKSMGGVDNFFFFFSSRRRHTRWNCDWSSDVCSSDLGEGAGKDGWHLKLPVAEGRVPDASIGARDELHATGSSDEIPPELRDLITPWVRTAVLGPVATLMTQRTAYLLRDESGEPLVELTDDLVSVLSSGHVAGR